MRKIEAVIFDWAGTTVDYGSFAPVQAFVEAFRSFGVTPTTAEVRAPMGMLKRNHIQTMMEMPRISAEWEGAHGGAWAQRDVDAVYAHSESAIMEILHDFAKPKPFVLEAIAQLRGLGIKIGSTTGYTDEMMAIVAPQARLYGYEPDAYFTPNAVGNVGRPYPFMVFENLKALKVSSVTAAIKVGDTVADIKEGLNAGLITVGVVEGSSVMDLSQEEYEARSPEQRAYECAQVRKVYGDAGANYAIQNMSELMDLIAVIEQKN